MTLEASFIMPMMLLLYLLIILTGFFLYDRCVISQDHFLLALRGSRFTDEAEDYGEVIYGQLASGRGKLSYMKERAERKTVFYPFYSCEALETGSERGYVYIRSEGKKGALCLQKKAQILNPVAIKKEEDSWR